MNQSFTSSVDIRAVSGNEDERSIELPKILCAKGEVLLETLRRHKWNISATSNELNVSRSTIYRKMGRYHIKQPNMLY